MRLHKALRQAARLKHKLRRDWWQDGLSLIPSNEIQGRITVFYPGDPPEEYRPTMDDIFENDWEVIE